MKNKLTGAILVGIMSTMLLTGCGSADKSSNENNADKVSNKVSSYVTAETQAKFDNKEEMIHFIPNTSDKLITFFDNFEVEDYEFVNAVNYKGGDSNSRRSDCYILTYKYVGEKEIEEK